MAPIVSCRALNNITMKDISPIQNMEELLDELHCNKYFSKLDLHLGYHHIRVAAKDNPKITLRTHERRWFKMVMLF